MYGEREYRSDGKPGEASIFWMFDITRVVAVECHAGL